MTLYIYRRQPSQGAVRLTEKLRELGVRAKKMSRVPRRWPEGSRVVFWGDVFPEYHDDEFAGMLNNVTPVSKVHELKMLADAGVPTVEFDNGVGEARPGENWLGRRNNHVGGNDLLADYGFTPDYWVKKEEIVREYRIHVFRGQSIRAGRKEPFREDSHPWIRSHDGGWHLVYDGHGVTAKHRDVAKAAIAALGLDFGAVDVGERVDGSVLVFEVNRAPGLEGNTVNVYAQMIKQWYEEAA